MTLLCKVQMFFWRVEIRGVARHVSRLPGNPQEVGVTCNANAVTRAEHVPVTTSECERTVSVLRRLKTYLRSTMRQDRLSTSSYKLHNGN